MSASHLSRNYGHLDSPIHRIPASVKLLATLAAVTGLVLLPVRFTSWWWGLGALAAALAVARVAHIPLSSFAGRIALVQPFVLGVVVLAVFQGRGLTIALAVGIKSTACVALVQLLAHTTPFTDILDALRRAGVPLVLTLTLELLHRYSAVLIEESQRMRRARAARTWGKGRWAAWKALASVIAVSFVRSVTRSERIAASMQARTLS